MGFNTIFFIGPQGSGKGTQARLLAEKLSFFYWEMGGILRAVAKEDSELGRKVKTQIDSGILLGDDDLLEVVKLRIGQMPKSQVVIFDGIPRRLWQAEFLMDYLKKHGRQKINTPFIVLPKEEAVGRW